MGLINKLKSDEIDLNNMGSTSLLPILLKRFVYSGQINKAEDMLFDEIKKNKSEQIYKIAEDFYEMLLDKTDEALKKANFSREEVYQGLQDVKNIFNK